MIRSEGGGKYRVVSHSGRNLGGGLSKSGARKRLREVDYFKHRDQTRKHTRSFSR